MRMKQKFKSSKVDNKDKNESKGKGTLFKFDCEDIDDKLCLKLTEIDTLAHFVYIREI